eukprot:2706873-Pyramimonas_sp.AAC.1
MAPSSHLGLARPTKFSRAQQNLPGHGNAYQSLPGLGKAYRDLPGLSRDHQGRTVFARLGRASRNTARLKASQELARLSKACQCVHCPPGLPSLAGLCNV